MLRNDLTVEVRDRNLQRLGVITPRFLRFKATLRHNDVDTWSLQLPGTHPMAGPLRTEGSGIIVTQRLADGSVRTVLSGPVDKPKRKRNAEAPDGWVEIQGVSDDQLLLDALAWGDPAHELDAQTQANDVRSAAAETLMHAYVSANIGPAALSSRRVGTLREFITMGTDGARGGVQSRSPRFQPLMELLQDLGTLSGLRFRLVQVGSSLVFETEPVTDARALVRLDVDNGTLESEETEASPPSVTRVIVAGQGEGATRTLVECTSSEATAAETSWGRVVERWVDQRNTNDLGELQQAGDEQLAKGLGVYAIRASAADAQLMRYGQEWREGDWVSVVIDRAEYGVQVMAAALVVGADAVKVGAAIGDVATLDEQAALESRVAAQDQRLNALERTAETSQSAVEPEPDTVLRRDASGRTQAADPVAVEDVATKGYVDDTVAGLGGGVYHVGEPVGSIHFTLALTTDPAPDGCLWLEGGTASRTTYSELFAKWGTRFGAGDGSTTFGLRDMRGLVPVGWKGSGVFNATPGTAVGAETHTLTIAEMPSHEHKFPAGITVPSPGAIGAVATTLAAGSAFGYGYVAAPGLSAIDNTGGGGAHNNVQPSLVGRWYVRAANVTLAPTGSTAASAPTPNTVALRDSAGRTQTTPGASAADVAVMAQLPNPNLIINGRCRTNQRGYVSGTDLALNAYGPDRWKATTASSRLTFTATPQGQAMTIPSGDSWAQDVERANIDPGQHTLSWEGTAQARVYNVGASAPAYASSPIVVSLDGAANVRVEFGPGTFDKVKLERGTVATPFVLPSLADEVALCQRYYVRFESGLNYITMGAGAFYSSTGADVFVTLPVPMRVAPNVSQSNLGLSDTATVQALTSLTVRNAPSLNTVVLRGTVASGFAAYRPAFLATSSGTGVLAFDAEL